MTTITEYTREQQDANRSMLIRAMIAADEGAERVDTLDWATSDGARCYISKACELTGLGKFVPASYQFQDRPKEERPNFVRLVYQVGDIHPDELSRDPNYGVGQYVPLEVHDFYRIDTDTFDTIIEMHDEEDSPWIEITEYLCSQFGIEFNPAWKNWKSRNSAYISNNVFQCRKCNFNWATLKEGCNCK